MRSDTKVSKDFALRVFGLLPPSGDTSVSEEEVKRLVIPNLITFSRPDALSKAVTDMRKHFPTLRWVSLPSLMKMEAHHLKKAGIQVGKAQKTKNQWMVVPFAEHDEVKELRFHHNTVFLITFWKVGGEISILIAAHPYQPQELIELREKEHQAYLSRQEKPAAPIKKLDVPVTA